MSGAAAVVDDVTVVVPTLGGPELEGCLNSIRGGAVWPARLVVVDQGGGAAPHWYEDLRAAGMVVDRIATAPLGISGATNRGVHEAETPYVAVTHDDCRVDHRWLETISTRVRQIGRAVLTGRVEPEGTGRVLTVITSRAPAVHRRPIRTGDFLFPPNMAFSTAVFEEVGPFDEHPSLRLAGEDNDWAYRALRLAIPIVYEPEAVVGHLARHTDAQIAALYRRYARGQGSFYGKHLRRLDAFIATRAARDLLRAPWLLLRGMAERNPELIAMGRGEVLGLLPGILAGLRNPGVSDSRGPRPQAST